MISNLNLLLIYLILIILNFGIIFFIIKLILNKKVSLKKNILISVIYSILSSIVPIFGLLMTVFILANKYFINSKANFIIKKHGIYSKDIKKMLHVKNSFSPGGAVVRLVSNYLKSTDRITALIAIKNVHPAESNKIIKNLLEDDNYELRLFAFKHLEQQENKINDIIDQLLNKLEIINDSEDLFINYKQLASVYWEAVYLNIVQDNLAQEYLNLSLKYAKKALGIKMNDTSLFIMLGKIYFHKQMFDEAIIIFNKIRNKQKIFSTTIDSYLAEIYFELKNYDKVREILSNNKMLLDAQKTNIVHKLWCQHDNYK